MQQGGGGDEHSFTCASKEGGHDQEINKATVEQNKTMLMSILSYSMLRQYGDVR